MNRQHHHHTFFRLMRTIAFALGLWLIAWATPLQAQNLPPAALDTLSFCTQAMQPVTICLHAADPNGDDFGITGGYTTFNCSLNFLNDTCVRYTPLPAFTGTDYVYLTLCDDQSPAACAEAMAIVNVGCVAPQAHTDQIAIAPTAVVINGNTISTTTGYNGVIFNALTNDDPVCGNSLSLPLVLDAPAHGSASVVGTSLVSYTPQAGFSGSDQFTYIACNDCPLCDTAVVTINILPANGSACDQDINTCTLPFTPLELCPEFCLLAPAQINTLSTSALHGSLNDADEGCIVYIPEAGFTGIDIVTAIACGGGICDTTYTFITIGEDCGTNPPQANDDYAATNPETVLLVYPLLNDIDPEGSPLNLDSYTQPEHGTLAPAVSGGLLYTPNAGFWGNDSFSYTTCDPMGLCSQATVYILVNAPCLEQYEYCTPNFLSPVEMCIQFCDLIGHEDVSIEHATTTFNCSIHLIGDTCIRYTPLPGFVGTDLVTLIACDADGVCDTVTATVIVGCMTPEAYDDIALTDGAPLSINVLGNDVELCSNTLSSALLIAPAHGTASVQANGTASYTPNPGFSGIDYVTYLACNNCSPPKCDTAVLAITVNSSIIVPPAPNILAQPDVIQTRFGTSVSIPVLSNDIGADVSIVSFSIPEHGAVATTPAGLMLYIPSPGYSGVDYFLYQICNDDGECSQTLVAVTVLPNGSPAQAPIAHNDIDSTGIGTPIAVHVLYNDNDPENGNLLLASVTTPTQGTAAIGSGGVINYTPPAGFSGIATFNYTVCDQQGLCADATVAIAVGVVYDNQFPIAQNDTRSVAIGAPATVWILNNDSDPEGDPLTVTLTSVPAHGTAAFDAATGAATYTPNATFEGLDYFTYMICDAANPPLCDTAYVTLTVGNGNLPPAAQNDVATTYINTPLNVAVLNNDDDINSPDSDLILSIISPPANGTAVVVGQQISYTPNTDFLGSDQFTYQVCDPEGECDQASVSISVVPDLALPNAQPDIATTSPNTAVVIAVMNNDSGDQIMVSDATNPANGTVTITDESTIIYVPNADFAGTDVFEYQICNPLGECDQAPVSVTITNINQAPIAVNDVYSVAINTSLQMNVANNDSDPEGEALSVTSVEQPTNGTSFTTDWGISVVYLPNPGFEGVDTFSYTICDPQGLCDIAMVAITVGAGNTNHAPIALPDYDITAPSTPVSIGVTNNDSDQDGDALSIGNITTPSNGTAIINGGDITYMPNNGFSGTDFFIYTVCDNGIPSLCDTAFVQITITTGADTADIAVITPEDQDISICIDQYITDLGFDIDSIAFVALPQNGSPYYVSDDDCIAYSPNANFVGNDQMSVSVCSEAGNCTTINIAIVVSPENDIPQAQDDNAETLVGQAITIGVLTNDIELDGETLTVIQVGTPANGTVSINPDGTVTYIPNPDFVGIDTFSYTASDPTSANSTATVTVTVSDTPIFSDLAAQDDTASTNSGTVIDINVLENDTYDTDATVVIGIAQDAQNGTTNVTWSNGTINYTPNTDFVGIDSLSYTLCQGGICDTAWVVIHIYANSDTVTTNCAPKFADGFSPNGDGTNDIWLIADMTCGDQAILSIFNRWGDIVYRTEHYDNTDAWNGNLNNQTDPVPDGTYFYSLQINIPDTEVKAFSGYIELKR